MQQVRQKNGKVRALRVDSAIPRHWQSNSMDYLVQLHDPNASACITVDVTHSHKSKFEKLLRRGVRHHCDFTGVSRCTGLSSQFLVRNVLRVENIPRWHQYLARHRQVKLETGDENHLEGADGLHLDGYLLKFARSLDIAPSGANEFVLFHGTSNEHAMNIAREGFDFRIARDVGYYGKGVYFASQSCKSSQYSTGAVKTMIVARVVLGQPHYIRKVDKQIMRPPPMPNSSIYYHSVIAKPGPMPGHVQGHQSHTEFVIFDSSQAYPEYIVEYELT